MSKEELAPTKEERQWAAACHALSIPFPYLSPIVFFALKRGSSRFVALHAAQAFFEALLLNIVLFLALGVSLMFTLAKVLEAIETRGQSLTWDDLWMALIKGATTWLILAAISLVYTVKSAIQALQAYRGEWRGSLFAGRLAKRVVGSRELSAS
ncbi:MAG TPA: DUF4870 domain-containing protein [Fimbriimonadaceae bacterium]|nr:DUF4870 domain-containing protein [Fimbriimonadaceae bacterium]